MHEAIRSKGQVHNTQGAEGFRGEGLQIAGNPMRSPFRLTEMRSAAQSPLGVQEHENVPTREHQ